MPSLASLSVENNALYERYVEVKTRYNKLRATYDRDVSSRSSNNSLTQNGGSRPTVMRGTRKVNL